MQIKVIATKDAPAPGHYSQALKLKDLIFISGQVPVNPVDGKLIKGGIEKQTRQALENMKAVLLAAGSDCEHILKITVFLKNIRDFAAFNKVYAEYFTGTRPARSCVEVSSLPKMALIEIDAIACVG